MHEMIQWQIIRRGITDPLLISAMESVDRAIFVPEHEKDEAYGDFPLPIGFGQTISQPYIVAYMVDQLHLKKDNKVLEIGTGSGYQTAVLYRMGTRVFSIETIEELALKASVTLRMNGFDDVSLKQGDGYEGWPEEAPFDGIIVSAAAPTIPSPLVDQLADYGKMIIPVGPAYGSQYLVLIEKKGGSISEHRLLGVRFVPFVSEKF